jgi:DNA uptake protein ComE-like DNA-binding protein
VEGERALKQRVSDLEGELITLVRERDAARKAEQAALEEARAAKDATDSKLQEMEKEHEKREADLKERFIERQAALEKQLDEVEERLDSREQSPITKPVRAGARHGGKLDLNGATFEQLRDIGLSVTQSARVIAYRDAAGGFQSVDELQEIPGLSVELKQVLGEQVTIG